MLSRGNALFFMSGAAMGGGAGYYKIHNDIFRTSRHVFDEVQSLEAECVARCSARLLAALPLPSACPLPATTLRARDSLRRTSRSRSPVRSSPRARVPSRAPSCSLRGAAPAGH